MRLQIMRATETATYAEVSTSLMYVGIIGAPNLITTII